MVSVAGRDEFRAPKELALRASAILVGSILVLGFTLVRRQIRDRAQEIRVPLYLAGAVIAWTTLTTAVSVNPWLSIWSLLYVCSSVLFFVGAVFAVRDRKWAAVYVFLAPAFVNVAALTLQEFRLWDFYSLQSVSNRTALIGNPNDTGAYLLAPAIAAAALITATRTRRIPHAVGALVLAAGIFMTQSQTAIGAYLVAIIILVAMGSWKRTAAGLLLVGCAVGLVFQIYSPLRDRVERVQTAIETRDYNLLTSFRLTAMVAAVEMFKDRPLIGVGPGCYAWRYFDEKIGAEARYPYLAASGERGSMFGEAHSDYLQILAVTGLPGLSLLFVSLAVLASFSVRRHSPAADDFRQRFVRSFSLPLASGTAVLLIAQFPLELAASTSALLYGAAICCSWRAVANH